MKHFWPRRQLKCVFVSWKKKQINKHIMAKTQPEDSISRTVNFVELYIQSQRLSHSSVASEKLSAIRLC